MGQVQASDIFKDGQIFRTMKKMLCQLICQILESITFKILGEIAFIEMPVPGN
jgi:hypothetical protein